MFKRPHFPWSLAIVVLFLLVLNPCLATTDEAWISRFLLRASGVPHGIWVNDTTQPLLFTATLTPAGPQGEHFFECLAGLGASYGNVTAIHPLQMAVLLSDAGVEMHGVPPGVTWAFKNMLAPVAKHLFGFHSSFGNFVTSRKHVWQQQQQLVAGDLSKEQLGEQQQQPGGKQLQEGMSSSQQQSEL